MLQTQSTRPAPKTNDMGASREWATRPADERFWTIEDMHQAVVAHKERTIDIPALLSSVEVGSPDRRSLELYTGGDRQTPATFTNFSFGQICERVKAAKPYLTTLPAPIVADCLNYGLSEYGLRTERGPHSVTFEVSPDGRGKQGAVELRCVASEIYNRIWNADITDWLRRLPDLGWRVPPARPNGMPGLQTRAATQDDVLNDQHGFLSINVGDMIAPAGLYASDRDCFAFFVNEDFPIDTGDGQPMSRAFYVSNAEVPGRSFRAKFFGYEHVCGNHIIWGGRLMADIRVRHVGTNADEAVDQIKAQLTAYTEQSVMCEQNAIQAARQAMLGNSKSGHRTKESVMEDPIWRKVPVLNQKQISRAIDVATDTIDLHKASPFSAWGVVQGLTRLSQQTPHMDQRESLDDAAGRVIELVTA